jgi:hypothetical protein
MSDLSDEEDFGKRKAGLIECLASCGPIRMTARQGGVC